MSIIGIIILTCLIMAIVSIPAFVTYSPSEVDDLYDLLMASSINFPEVK